MSSEKQHHKEEMFDNLSQAIENTGKSDADYSDIDKALDILDVLESLLAYTIYTTCENTDQIRDSCEESYLSIKRRALQIFQNHQQEDKS